MFVDGGGGEGGCCVHTCVWARAPACVYACWCECWCEYTQNTSFLFPFVLFSFCLSQCLSEYLFECVSLSPFPFLIQSFPFFARQVRVLRGCLVFFFFSLSLSPFTAVLSLDLRLMFVCYPSPRNSQIVVL